MPTSPARLVPVAPPCSPAVVAALAAAVLVPGCAVPDDVVLARDLFAPTDLAVDGERVVFTQASGQVEWVAQDGADRGVIAPGAFTPRPGQIAIDPDSIDVAVGADHLAWTDHLDAGARLWIAPRAGGAPVVGATLALGRIADLAWHGARLCWLTPVALLCADDVGAEPRLVAWVERPRALALSADTAYWLEAGPRPGRDHAGRLVAAPLAGGERRELATLLDDPVALAVVGDQVYWIDAGSCTEGPGGCVRNRDAALRRVARAGGAPVTQAGGMVVIAGLAAVGGDADGVYFCADTDVWRTRGLGVEPLGVGHGCQALAVSEDALFLATLAEIERVGR